MKRMVVFGMILCFLLVGVMSVHSAGGRDGDGAAGRRSFTIAGADVGSVIYLNAAGMAELVNNESSSVRLSAQTTQGFVENVRLVGRGEVDFGFISTGVAYQGMTGTGSFQGEPPYSDILCIAVAYDGQMYIVAQEEFNSIEELAGRSINFGPPGSNLALYGNAILRGYGLYDSMRVSTLGINDGVQLFVERRVDAIMGGPVPYPAVLSVAAQARPRILSVSMDKFPAINEFARSYPVTIPSSTYDFMTTDAVTTGFANYIVAHRSIPDDIVFEVLSRMVTPDGIEYLKRGTPTWQLENSGTAIAQGDAVRVAGLKMHPGAVKFWEEQGFKVPDDIK